MQTTLFLKIYRVKNIICVQLLCLATLIFRGERALSNTKSDFGGKLEAFDKFFNFLEDSGLLLLSSPVPVASQRNLN